MVACSFVLFEWWYLIIFCCVPTMKLNHPRCAYINFLWATTFCPWHFDRLKLFSRLHPGSHYWRLSLRFSDTATDLGEVRCWGSNVVGESSHPCVFKLVAAGMLGHLFKVSRSWQTFITVHLTLDIGLCVSHQVWLCQFKLSWAWSITLISLDTILWLQSMRRKLIMIWSQSSRLPSPSDVNSPRSSLSPDSPAALVPCHKQF